MDSFFMKILFRSLAAVVVGVVIGSERARQGRAAGMRTHILVCLGAALTSMISVFAAEQLGNQGDLLRLSAQVVTGIGFLGAGMIILRENNIITGLTTAAGVWTTSIIGIALGLGFYAGALVVAALFLITISLLVRFERKKKSTQILYVEIDDMYGANALESQISEFLDVACICQMHAPKSGHPGHLGLTFVLEARRYIDVQALCQTEHVVFVEET